MPRLLIRSSRMVSPCAPVRFFTTGNSATHATEGLEIAQHDDGVGEETDVDAGLTFAGAGHQKLRGSRGLARAWISLEQLQAVAGPTACEYGIEAGNVVVRTW